MKKTICVVLLLFVSALFSGCSPERVVDIAGEAILLLNYKEEKEFVPLNFANSYIPQVRRNLEGDKLFINVGSKLVSIDPQAIKTISAPAACSFLDENEQFVAWFNNLREGVCFKNGQIRPVMLEERFGVDPSGAYFYVSAYSSGSSTIYSTSRPDSPLLTIPSFIAYVIFFYDNTIYVFGSPVSKTGLLTYKEVGFEIATSNNTYSVQKSFNIPGAVVDMSPRTKRLLLDNGSDLIPLWFLYDMKTRKKRFISKRDLHGFFITYDLAERFKEKDRTVR